MTNECAGFQDAEATEAMAYCNGLFARGEAFVDTSNQQAMDQAIRALLADLNSAGRTPYESQRGSRTITVDAAVVRYLIAYLQPGIAPRDCG